MPRSSIDLGNQFSQMACFYYAIKIISLSFNFESTLHISSDLVELFMIQQLFLLFKLI